MCSDLFLFVLAVTKGDEAIICWWTLYLIAKIQIESD